jgi:hypothetical protein
VIAYRDGSMSAGMAYEAMNNAGAHKNRLIVILNDNDIHRPPVGAMSAYLARLVSSRPYTGIRNIAKRLAQAVAAPCSAVQAPRNLPAAWPWAAPVRGDGFFMLARSTATTRPSDSGLENVRDTMGARCWCTS